MKHWHLLHCVIDWYCWTVLTLIVVFIYSSVLLLFVLLSIIADTIPFIILHYGWYWYCCCVMGWWHCYWWRICYPPIVVTLLFCCRYVVKGIFGWFNVVIQLCDCYYVYRVLTAAFCSRTITHTLHHSCTFTLFPVTVVVPLLTLPITTLLQRWRCHSALRCRCCCWWWYVVVVGVLCCLLAFVVCICWTAFTLVVSMIYTPFPTVLLYVTLLIYSRVVRACARYPFWLWFAVVGGLTYTLPAVLLPRPALAFTGAFDTLPIFGWHGYTFDFLFATPPADDSYQLPFRYLHTLFARLTPTFTPLLPRVRLLQLRIFPHTHWQTAQLPLRSRARLIPHACHLPLPHYTHTTCPSPTFNRAWTALRADTALLRAGSWLTTSPPHTLLITFRLLDYVIRPRPVERCLYYPCLTRLLCRLRVGRYVLCAITSWWPYLITLLLVFYYWPVRPTPCPIQCRDIVFLFYLTLLHALHGLIYLFIPHWLLTLLCIVRYSDDTAVTCMPLLLMMMMKVVWYDGIDGIDTGVCSIAVIWPDDDVVLMTVIVRWFVGGCSYLYDSIITPWRPWFIQWWPTMTVIDIIIDDDIDVWWWLMWYCYCVVTIDIDFGIINSIVQWWLMTTLFDDDVIIIVLLLCVV